MTEQELHTLKVNVYNVTDGVHEYSVSFDSKFSKSPIEYTFTNIKTGVENNIVFTIGLSGKYILHNPMKNYFLSSLSMILKQKEESKMKTTFKQEPPKKNTENTYPKFMKNTSNGGYVVLFFDVSSGVVVETKGSYHINYFSTTWKMDTFSPVENCEVTFSNKDS